jgi:hypothetical protein
MHEWPLNHPETSRNLQSKLELPLAEASRCLRLNPPPSLRFPRLVGRPRKTALPDQDSVSSAITHPEDNGGHEGERTPLPATTPTSIAAAPRMPIPEPIELQRDELYELVWSELVERLAASVLEGWSSRWT